MNTQKRPVRGWHAGAAFTLVEMLVVIAVIAILMAAVVAIGSSVRGNATRRATLAQLHVLDGLMKEYIAAGNPEPTVPSDPASANQWIYGTASDGGFRLFSFLNFYRTAPASDPYNWVAALRSVPEIAKKMDGMPSGTDEGVPKMSATPVVHKLILDSYGNHIRYVPSTANSPGYFMSSGPDGNFYTMVKDNKTSTITDNAYYESGPSGRNLLRADDIYSTDPQ